MIEKLFILPILATTEKSNNYKKINFNSFPSKDNSYSDHPTTNIKKKKYLYTKNKSTQLSYTHNSFSTKLYSSKIKDFFQI